MKSLNPTHPMLRVLKNGFVLSVFLGTVYTTSAQNNPPKGNDSNTPLHLLKPDYPVPYGSPTIESITTVLNRVHGYLEGSTPIQLVTKNTNEVVTEYKKINTETILKPGDFRLLSYEWGVTYAGMLLATEATGDPRYAGYTNKRLKFIADITPHFRELAKKNPQAQSPLRSVLTPHALDDAGAMCASLIKSVRAGNKAELRQLIDNYIDYITTKELRLSDGTLARNRPQMHTLWLDDLFMSVPALAQMGKLTGDKKYYDDAVKQVLQFSQRMFNKEKGLYMHGWVEGMTVHPEFHWARANGWAIMTKVELLDVLPEDHPGRGPILELLKAHAKGLAAYQSGVGFWHQLLDREDSYLETSATAIYAYSIARAINRGWLDSLAYAPMALLAWNAVSTKVNEKGQVEGTCVGTGMGFDPAFYYYRPINVYAAHGYGPVLLAGAEIIHLLKKNTFEINDSSVQLKAAR
ncbi:glycoside hydrolase family 88 protein [Cytophagaceae bacterium YF14B1]|uniref:Glycoside hydrolase family 88 protein n=1 Tax=Xanthocytophaga flava TaxID=3048013 RepID=A0AAE3QLG7_9BACT|nr:glycoside hydrolase family 88 protein [Xanthocytophaga flavus]MDJ1479593.1 glycoside hydrolase family 88 protein [Xanthocytophaga flavus]